ncbi:MAG: hypothetical protein EZS28_018263 [Streblomastix strix]|uniref:Uncharacterized protein n=1 Tax=Streblomastix strix TaxID=222440 RepID=A0A5J4VUZ6_9EUKA|nr:MAG: hypothetical protein EZS28_018263 [Streblomastix strix]
MLLFNIIRDLYLLGDREREKKECVPIALDGVLGYVIDQLDASEMDLLLGRDMWIVLKLFTCKSDQMFLTSKDQLF